MTTTLAMGAVVIGADDRVLLVRRANPPLAGEWTLPGGKPMRGESFAEAVAREVREETGLDVVVHCVVDVVVVEREGFRYDIHEHLCTPLENPAAVPQPGDDALEARWASDADVEALGVRADARRVIAIARRVWASKRC